MNCQEVFSRSVAYSKENFDKKKTAQQWEEEEEKIIFISQKFSLSLDFFLFLFFLMIAAAPKNMFSLTRNIFQTFASRIS